MAERHRVRRRRWSEEEKRQIVAQTLIPGMSVSQVARRYDVNTNLVFTWRRNPRLRPAEAQELGFRRSCRWRWSRVRWRNPRAQMQSWRLRFATAIG